MTTDIDATGSFAASFRPLTLAGVAVFASGHDVGMRMYFGTAGANPPMDCIGRMDEIVSVELMPVLTGGQG